MNESEKIKLLKYLWNKYPNRENIFRDKDKKLLNISFKEYQNFLCWGKENGSLNFYDCMRNDYNIFNLTLESGSILDNLEELNNFQDIYNVDIENKKIRKIDWKWIIGIIITIISIVVAIIIAL